MARGRTPDCRSKVCERLVDRTRPPPPSGGGSGRLCVEGRLSVDPSQWTGAFAKSADFARECHERYAALGLGQPVGEWRRCHREPPTTFHAPRVAVLGEVSPELAAAVFPQMASTGHRECRGAGAPCGSCERTMVDARGEGAVASLRRILGPEPYGIESFAVIMRRAATCWRSAADPSGRVFSRTPWDGDALADSWHGAEILREVRGDAHNATWLGRGITAPQIHILTEHWYGLTGCGFRRLWGWTDAELDQGEGELVESVSLIRRADREGRERREQRSRTAPTPRWCRS